MKVTKEVREFLSAMGRRGGQVRSERKAQAVRKNATMPRPNARGKRTPKT